MKTSLTKLNLFMGLLGLLIIWLATHNFIAIVGGIIAGIHITITVSTKK